jgi:hypothetical protein
VYNFKNISGKYPDPHSKGSPLGSERRDGEGKEKGGEERGEKGTKKKCVPDLGNIIMVTLVEQGTHIKTLTVKNIVCLC